MAHDLNVLLRLSEEINAIRRADVLQEKLLERIFDIVPAQQGTIRLSDEKQRGFISTVTRQRTRVQSFYRQARRSPEKFSTEALPF